MKNIPARTTNIELRLRGAITLLEQGKNQQARIALEKLLLRSPRNFNVLHLLGAAAFSLKDYQVAIDFIEKPIAYDELLVVVDDALGRARDSGQQEAKRAEAVRLLSGLTDRQREIMDMILAGHPNKNIAADLKISQRTVENHRAAIMQKTGTKSLPALARLALAAVRPVEAGDLPR